MRIFKLTLIAIAASVAWSAYAEAIEVKKRREAPGVAAEVWALVGGFCDIQKWHPAVAKCEETTKDGKVFRTLTLKDGAKIEEEQTKKETTSYSYTIISGPLPVKDYHATLTVGADDEPDRVEILLDGKIRGERRERRRRQEGHRGHLRGGRRRHQEDRDRGGRGQGKQRLRVDASSADHHNNFVIAGFFPAIHVFCCGQLPNSWMPGTRPGMTKSGGWIS